MQKISTLRRVDSHPLFRGTTGCRGDRRRPRRQRKESGRLPGHAWGPGPARRRQYGGITTAVSRQAGTRRLRSGSRAVYVVAVVSLVAGCSTQVPAGALAGISTAEAHSRSRGTGHPRGARVHPCGVEEGRRGGDGPRAGAPAEGWNLRTRRCEGRRRGEEVRGGEGRGGGEGTKWSRKTKGCRKRGDTGHRRGRATRGDEPVGAGRETTRGKAGDRQKTARRQEGNGPRALAGAGRKPGRGPAQETAGGQADAGRMPGGGRADAGPRDAARPRVLLAGVPAGPRSPGTHPGCGTLAAGRLYDPCER